MNTHITRPQSDQDILDCFPVMSILRPHIAFDQFVGQVRRQQQQGYQLVAQIIGADEDQRVVSAAGFRLCEFLAWGKVLYVDDLITLPDHRGHGYAGQLLDWLIEQARSQGCQALHLDSGYARHDAHRLYLNKGLQLACHHFSITL